MVYRCIDSGISDLVDMWIGNGSDNISGGGYCGGSGTSKTSSEVLTGL